MSARPSHLATPAVRAALFFLASNAAVLFALQFGRTVWPEGLPAHAHNAFWPASGVNLAGLLLLGLRYWPIIVLDAFPAWLIAGEDPVLSLTAATTNALEALLAAWMVLRLGRGDGRPVTVRAVAAILAASLIAPLVNTVIMPATFCARGFLPWSAYPEALGHWNLANGAAILMVAPFLVAVFRGKWQVRGREREAAAFAAAALVLAGLAFHALFSGTGTNITFLVFPAVLYAAARFGSAEVSAVLAAVLVTIYLALATHAQALTAERMASAIWFSQAFCWVLAATGFLVAALVGERQDALNAARRVQERMLEANLAAEKERLAALRHQIHPHFLFNTLNSISSTLPADGTIPRHMLERLSRYLRATLDTPPDDRVTLRQELAVMGEYLGIEQVRYGRDLQVVIHADEAALAALLPGFLLQPLIENAVVHGFGASQGAFLLEIRATVDGDRLRILVANTGRWKDGGAGVGLTNTRRRITLAYGAEGELTAGDNDGRVEVVVTIPRRSAPGGDSNWLAPADKA